MAGTKEFSPVVRAVFESDVDNPSVELIHRRRDRGLFGRHFDPLADEVLSSILRCWSIVPIDAVDAEESEFDFLAGLDDSTPENIAFTNFCNFDDRSVHELRFGVDR